MPVLIPVVKIQAVCDPFTSTPWMRQVVSRSAIANAIAQNRLDARPWETAKTNTMTYHVGRIAFLAVHGWTDAIDLDVGVPSLGCHVDWKVLDGNHRLGAAIYRGDANILSSVTGDMAYAFELFGVDVAEPGY